MQPSSQKGRGAVHECTAPTSGAHFRRETCEKCAVPECKIEDVGAGSRRWWHRLRGQGTTKRSKDWNSSAAGSAAGSQQNGRPLCRQATMQHEHQTHKHNTQEWSSQQVTISRHLLQFTRLTKPYSKHADVFKWAAFVSCLLYDNMTLMVRFRHSIINPLLQHLSSWWHHPNQKE
jgi:hypothetical protein